MQVFTKNKATTAIHFVERFFGTPDQAKAFGQVSCKLVFKLGGGEKLVHQFNNFWLDGFDVDPNLVIPAVDHGCKPPGVSHRNMACTIVKNWFPIGVV